MSIAISLAESGIVPDAITRMGIRRLLRTNLVEREVDHEQGAQRHAQAFIDQLRQSPIAIEQDAANSQHYEVPAGFYQLCLGEHLKYSSCWWEDGANDLSSAERDMLDMTMARADLKDGQDVLEIGCGWGSLTLAMAERFPNSRIHAISNSQSQGQFIRAQARSRGLNNVEIETADIASYSTPLEFDRVVSVECLEHCRNYGELFSRIHSWLRPQGTMFVHVFCHRTVGYPFETEGDDNWMGQHFFTGGIMPSFDLFRSFDDHMEVVEDWRVDGTNYAKTARAWLKNIDNNRDEVLRLMTEQMGRQEAKVMFQRWRMFFMACEELFGYRDGKEWLVGHYLLRPKQLAQLGDVA